jgi:hypothetical protein
VILVNLLLTTLENVIVAGQLCRIQDIPQDTTFFIDELYYTLSQISPTSDSCYYTIAPPCTICKYGYKFSGTPTNDDKECNLIIEHTIQLVELKIYSDSKCQTIVSTSVQNNYDCIYGFRINMLNHPYLPYEYIRSDGYKYNYTTRPTDSSYMMQECDKGARYIHVGGIPNKCMTYCNADGQFKSIMVQSYNDQGSNSVMIKAVIIASSIFGSIFLGIAVYYIYKGYKSKYSSKITPNLNPVDETKIDIIPNVEQENKKKKKSKKHKKKSKD